MENKMYSIAEGSTLKKAVTLCDNTKDKPKSRISKISPNQSITSSKYFLDSMKKTICFFLKKR